MGHEICHRLTGREWVTLLGSLHSVQSGNFREMKLSDLSDLIDKRTAQYIKIVPFIRNVTWPAWPPE